MKTILLIGLLSCVSLFTYAQQENLRNMSAEDRARLQTERMTTTLELDSVLADLVNEINFRYSQQMEEGKKREMSRYDMMQMMQKSNKEKNKEMKAILTKYQYKK
ncbi:hypothetical protein ACFLU5_05255 [Bacteroidota bacterium]